ETGPAVAYLDPQDAPERDDEHDVALPVEEGVGDELADGEDRTLAQVGLIPRIQRLGDEPACQGRGLGPGGKHLSRVAQCHAFPESTSGPASRRRIATTATSSDG